MANEVLTSLLFPLLIAMGGGMAIGYMWGYHVCAMNVKKAIEAEITKDGEN
jgi:hypothetical protein